MSHDKNKVVKLKKADNFSKWYTEVIQKAELADYSDVSGCMVFRPACYAMWETVQKIIDENFKRDGIKNAYFPLLIPEKLLQKEAKHVEGFTPEVAWVTHAGNTKLSERLAIRPTSETIIYDSYAAWIRSWRDLPLRLNMWNNVVRWEFKNPVALLRTREFLWNEGHTVFATKKEADAERDVILGIYDKFLKDYMALHGIIGKKTEREKFAGAESTFSIELFLPSGKGIQGPDFHNDGQNFAKAFDITYIDKDEKKHHVYQNTFAITTRMLGVMIGIHGDDRGLVIPPRMAPHKAVVVPIIFEKSKASVLKTAQKVAKSLHKQNAFVDNRDGYSAGWKFNEWELKGIPLRIEIGPKDVEKKQVVIVRRDTNKKEFVKMSNVEARVTTLLKDMHDNMYKKSKEFILSSIITVKTWKELLTAVKKKKMALAPFCGDIVCEAKIKDKSKGITTRCIPLNNAIPKKGTSCIYCKKSAEHNVLFAKAY
jgi:prolyl-tRNA synthetase